METIKEIPQEIKEMIDSAALVSISMFLAGGNTEKEKDYFLLGVKAGLSLAGAESVNQYREALSKQEIAHVVADMVESITAGKDKLFDRGFSELFAINVLDVISKHVSLAVDTDKTFDTLRIEQAKERMYWKELAEAAQAFIYNCTEPRKYSEQEMEYYKKWQSLKQQKQ
jgi:hypothetical protein